MSLLKTSDSPHIFAGRSAKAIMWDVVIALAPVMLVSFYFFGLGAILITLTSVLTCLVTEFIIVKFFFKSAVTLSDGSAVITGILLAFNLPSNLPWWEVVLGGIVAIAVAKMTFGGLGKNIFNPALVGRAFLLVSFPVDMMTWPLPIINRGAMVDAITGPTVLGTLKEGARHGETMDRLMQKIPAYKDMLLGNMGGSLGEICAVAIILGGLFLLFRKVISWHTPVIFVFSVFALTGVFWLANPMHHANPLIHILSGGLLLGAFFMATDMVTSPMTGTGKIIFGAGCGILTFVIRTWGAYPEGVSFAILIMNAFVPLINRACKPRRFGRISNVH